MYTNIWAAAEWQLVTTVRCRIGPQDTSCVVQTSKAARGAHKPARVRQAPTEVVRCSRDALHVIWPKHTPTGVPAPAKKDAVQRRMLRPIIVGWAGLANEPWRATMHRMKSGRSEHRTSPDRPWTTRLGMRQHSFGSHVAETRSWAIRVCDWHPEVEWHHNFAQRPTRLPDHPLSGWDDQLRAFYMTDIFPARLAAPTWQLVQHGNTQPANLSVNF